MPEDPRTNPLDQCSPVPPVVTTTPPCDSEDSPCCTDASIEVGGCGGTPIGAPEGKCVNDITRMPWPTPPPVELGCNPVSLGVTNTAPAPDDEDQTMRLEGEVSYISSDPCLPKLNLRLVAPPAIIAGGGFPTFWGNGITRKNKCKEIGPNPAAKYKNPQDFLGHEPGASGVLPTDSFTSCDPCETKSRFGNTAAEYNIIGPILAKVTQAATSLYSVVVEGVTVTIAYSYKCIFLEGDGNNCAKIGIGGTSPSEPSSTAGECLGGLSYCSAQSRWSEGGHELTEPDEPDETDLVAYNIKENLVTTPADGDILFGNGINLTSLVLKGYKPKPVAAGTQVLLYGYVPWGTKPVTTPPPPPNQQESEPNTDACECPIVWFFDELNPIDGECTPAAAASSLVPQTKLLQAGKFFGYPKYPGV